mgnify:FL=1
MLSLCNALLNIHYSDPAELEITTLDGIFFDYRKNDISCKIRQLFLVLIEQQSSVNLNMPFRCLAYVTDLLNKLIKNKRTFYRNQIIRLPSPKFFVLYDGNDFSLELIVSVININYGNAVSLTTIVFLSA